MTFTALPFTAPQLRIKALREQGLSVAEIATALNLKDLSVRSALSKARAAWVQTGSTEPMPAWLKVDRQQPRREISERERAILADVVAGQCAKVIARKHGLTHPQRVYETMRHIRDVLGVRSDIELGMRMARDGVGE